MTDQNAAFVRSQRNRPDAAASTALAVTNERADLPTRR